MSYYKGDDINPGEWYYDDKFKEYIHNFGVESLLDRLDTKDIEQYLRKKKLENLWKQKS